MNFIIGFIVVIIYIGCAVGIWGADDEKRYPFIGIPAQIAAYMLYIFINDGQKWSFGWIVWTSLSVITVILIIISFFSKKESTKVADIFSLLIVALLAVPPFLSTTSINFSLQYSKNITIDEGLVIYGAGFSLLLIICISILFYIVYQKKLRPVRLKIPSSNHAVADFLLCDPFSKFPVSHCCCNYGKCTTPFS